MRREERNEGEREGEKREREEEREEERGEGGERSFVFLISQSPIKESRRKK
jgi:hypothetical protein